RPGVPAAGAAGGASGGSLRRSDARLAPGTRRARPPAVVAGSSGSGAGPPASAPAGSSWRTSRSDSNHQGAGRGPPDGVSGAAPAGTNGRSPAAGSGIDGAVAGP